MVNSSKLQFKVIPHFIYKVISNDNQTIAAFIRKITPWGFIGAQRVLETTKRTLLTEERDISSSRDVGKVEVNKSYLLIEIIVGKQESKIIK